ncbi:MAG: CinA family protein, partial [Sphingobacteriales bacterium]
MLKSRLQDVMVVDKDQTLQEVIGDLLVQLNKTIGTAESCTGGYLAHLLTSIAGSSRYFQGSIVSYANQIKEDILQVDPDIIKQFGAVSRETAVQMVKGALKV